jgi:hypothetical protein
MRRGALICGLLACAALAWGGCGGDSGTVSSTPTPVPTQSTATTSPSTATAAPPTATATTPATGGATITQIEAKAASRNAASREAAKGGVSLGPDQWDARCTAVGGRDRAATWRCQVASLGGRCTGTLTAHAAASDVAEVRDVQVACGG